MTGYQTLVARLRSPGEEAAGPRSWDDAPAPAQVARRVLQGLRGREVPVERIGVLTTVTHWTYGTLWGAWYGLVQESARAPALAHGALFGAGVWGTSYLTLVPMGIYRPPWEYSRADLALDLSYHLVYGEAVAGAHRAIVALGGVA